MASRINPAFHRHPTEAAVIGRLLAAFGELEFMVCRCAGEANQNLYPILKALYRIKTTSARMASADALTRPVLRKIGLDAEYATTLLMVKQCLAIRNQYAHCNWADQPFGESGIGLYFADVEETAQSDEEFDFFFLHVSEALLKKQEDYFVAAMDWLMFLIHELAGRGGFLGSHSAPRPSELSPPPKHNPPEKHIPPWLTSAEKEKHLAKALARKGGPPTPTGPQKALDAARAKKRERKEADRARGRAEHSRRK